jgi:hypothetical protein
MLNYITLNIDNKDVTEQLKIYCSERFHKFHWLITTCSVCNFAARIINKMMIKDVSNVLIATATANLLIIVLFYRIAYFFLPRFKQHIHLIILYSWFIICCILFNLSV